MATGIWCGPAGRLVEVVRPAPGSSADRQRQGAVHQLAAGGGQVVDTTGRRRVYRLVGQALNADELGVWEQLAELGGPYRLVDLAGRRNHLTANQSLGTGPLADATGFSALTQGAVSSSTAQARSGVRSLAWDTQTALAATGRGVLLYTSASTVDQTWAACLPSTQYTVSAYVRASAAVSMQIGISFYNAATPPALLSSPSTAGSAVSTTDWSTRLSFTATSDATAAYAVPKLLNSTTTGSAVTVWSDDWQLEQAGSAGAFVPGTGTPVVAVDSLSDAYPYGGLHDCELVLVEVGG